MSQAHSRVELLKCLRSKSGHVIVLLASLLVGSAAWAQKIDVQFDASADFSKCKTFAIRNGTLNSELIKKQIEADIRRDLTTRGLTEAERPDLNVVYHFGSQQQDRA